MTQGAIAGTQIKHTERLQGAQRIEHGRLNIRTRRWPLFRSPPVIFCDRHFAHRCVLLWVTDVTLDFSENR